LVASMATRVPLSRTADCRANGVCRYLLLFSPPPSVLLQLQCQRITRRCALWMRHVRMRAFKNLLCTGQALIVQYYLDSSLLT
jgi:hypothetical protein